MENIEDLLDLREDYDDPIVSQILKERYQVKRVYTQIGDGTILFANPNEVHIYSIALQALTNIENGSHHESIVFCGESGSGKSSNFFHTLKFLCNSDNSKISAQQVDALREIIQNFGSAKTLKSELSTRCGYSIDLHYKAICAFEEAEKYGLNGPNKYFYLDQGKSNINMKNEGENFGKLSVALTMIGFSTDQKEWIAFLLNTDIGHIRRIFCDKHLMSDEREHTTVLKGIDTGLDVRDAFAKFLYNHLCGWIFSRISLFFQFSEPSRTISLVDAPGFEKYHKNGHDQMIVNAGNESLENVFLYKMFGDMWRSDESSNECAKSSTLANSQNVTNLLTKSPSGIIPLLEDECKFPKFGVKHYAGMAWYDVDGFLSRNRCAVLSSFHEVLRHCKDASMVSLYEYARARSPNGENEVHYVASVMAQHAAELNKRLQESNCLFVRCIRTNSQHQPGHFDTAIVSRQVKCLSIVEQCRALLHCCVRKLSFEEFAQKFKCLLTDDATRGQTPLQIARSVLETQGEQVQSEYKIDMEHVFLTENLWKQLQEVQRFTHNFAAMIIQRNWRKWSKHRKYRERKNAVIKLQSVYRGWRDRYCIESKSSIIETVYRKRVSQMKDGLLKCITQAALNRPFNCQKPNGIVSDVEFMKATSVCVDLAFPSPLQKLIKEAEIAKVETKQITDYIPLRKAAPNPIIVDTPISIEEFAAKNLKYHVLGKFRAPITTPFLAKNTDDEYEEAIQIFKLILRYTTDVSLNENQLIILAKYIIQLGIDNANQRDEIYVQLCNQTYKCSDSDGKRAWDLLLLATNSFAPGVLIFPMLYHQQPPLSTLLMDALLRPIKGTYGKGRLYAPTILEQASLCCRQPTVVEFNLSNGEKYAAEVDSWISADECVQKVLRHKGIGDSCGWCVELDYAGEIAHLSGNHSLFDAIAQKEKSHIEAHENSPFVFFDTKPKLRFNQNGNGHHSNGKNYDTDCKSDLMQSPQDIFSSAFQKYNNQNHTELIILGKSCESQTRNMNFISPRRQNANCMSRITEEDFPMVSRENTLKGFPMREYNDDMSRCQFDPKLLDMITASIKGGGDYEADPKHTYHNNGRHHYSGKDGYVDGDRNAENMDLPYDPRIFMRSAASRYNDDERFPISQHGYNNERNYKNADPYKAEPRYKPNDDVRIFPPVYTNGGDYGLSPLPSHNISTRNVSTLNPNYYLVERGRECDSLASRYLDEECDEEENEACNEWVHESEIPLIGSNYMSFDKQYDLRKPCPHRMRKYEIASLNEILLSNNISAHLGQLINEIPTAVKAQLIDAVRKWPLYFCRMYAVIEERPNDRVPLFIGISETGIRLISYNSVNEQDPMIIQDHFE
ncbi:myosin head (motor domain) domain-containing protein [Ditylenchus destructor]|nr:myosin head (motor domain) domain-containing protein [Ditylenchus destructor]